MDFSTIKDLENRFGFKLQKQNLCFTHGKGSHLFDTNSRPYLDLVCARGEVCLGYGDQELTRAVVEQAERLMTVSGDYYSQAYGQVLEKLLKGTGFSKAGLFGSASEAIITALTMIFGYLKENGDNRRHIVISSNNHSPISGLPHTVVEFNNFEALKKALTPDTAVLIIAPMTGGGLKIADYDYLVNAYALCKSMDIILFCDESRIGFGRTGNRFAFESYGVQPDVVCVSRGLAGGLPLGAVVTRDNFAAGFKPQKTNFDSGDLLSLAAANVILSRLENGLLDEVREKGQYLLSQLYKLTKYNFVLDVRGKGLTAGIELSGRIVAAKVVSLMEKNGFLLRFTDGNIIRFSPAFTITTEEIDSATNALMELFSSTNI